MPASEVSSLHTPTTLVLRRAGFVRKFPALKISCCPSDDRARVCSAKLQFRRTRSHRRYMPELRCQRPSLESLLKSVTKRATEFLVAIGLTGSLLIVSKGAGSLLLGSGTAPDTPGKARSKESEVGCSPPKSGFRDRIHFLHPGATASMF